MKKMFNLSVLLYLCFSIINTECTVTDTIGRLASKLNKGSGSLYVSIPLNILALYLAAKASNKGVDYIKLADAIKLNPEAHYNEIRNFCESLKKVQPVMTYDPFGSLYYNLNNNPALMYELLEITDKSNNNPVFVDFANKIADAIKDNSYAINNVIIPFFIAYIAFISGVICTTKNATA